MRFSGEVIEEFTEGKYADRGITVVDTTKTAKKVLDILWQKAEEKKVVGVDSEFDAHADPNTNPVQCLSVSWGEGKSVVVPVGLLQEFKPWLEEKDAPKVFQNYPADEEVLDAAGIKLAGLAGDTLVMDFLVDTADREHNLKHAVKKWLKRKMMGSFKEVFSYVPEGGKKPVMYTWQEIWESIKLQMRLVLYSADDPLQTKLLFLHHRRELIARGYWPTYLSEDLPFTLTLTNVMKRGFPIDVPRLSGIRTIVLIEMLRAQHVFRAHLKAARVDVRKLLPKNAKRDEEFNLRSSVQLKKLFFEELDLPQLKKTKTEKDKDADTATSCDASVLEAWMENFAKDYPLGARLADVLLGYRGNKALEGTFLTGILNGVEPADADGNIIHHTQEELLKESIRIAKGESPRLQQPALWLLFSNLNQIGARTGRISSRKYTEEVEESYEDRYGEEQTRIVKKKKGANLQNIPTQRTDDYGIRAAFVAPPGEKLVVIDMAGFEWWLMAHWSQDPLMLKQNRKKLDPHGITAARFYDLPTKLMDWCTLNELYKELKKKYAEERDDGKKGNFGFIYGCKAPRAAQIIGKGCTEERAQELLDIFFEELYTYIVMYHEKQIAMARDLGYVETISQRRVHIDEILDDHPGKVAHAENQARNAPIQGSAADIMKAIMNCMEFGRKLFDKHHKSWFAPEADQKKVMLVKEAYERADYVRRKLGARQLIQVHDELVQRVKEEHAEECTKHTIFIMENHRYMPQLSVHIAAEGKWADNWKAAK
jgi:DNA polymerase-1